MIRVAGVAFVRFRAPDLSRMEEFLIDFGLVRAARSPTQLFMRGAEPDRYLHVTEVGEPGFAGVAFAAGSRADLVALADREKARLEPLDGPGGGERVQLRDPDGFALEVVHGIEPLPALPGRGPLPRNDCGGDERIGRALRLPTGPAHVKRLGHVLLEVRDLRESTAWYAAHLGLLTSDEVRAGDAPVATFLRCDRGALATDHHSLALAASGAAAFGHAAFEVLDFDDLMIGHDQLASCGHEHSHGVGRHVLGSQIFDYWRDPWRHVLEHWTDGDRFDADTPPNVVPAAEGLASQWGAPTVPPRRGSPSSKRQRGRTTR
jgi:catechol 2,3-dioxygenase-like lactoylglutathione lyase family enzyme